MAVSDNVFYPAKWLIEQVLCNLSVSSAFVTNFDPSRFFVGLGICVCALLLGASLESLYDRILAYLEYAEFIEPDVWLRDDIRMAWMIVRLLQQCVRQNPYVLACYAVTGVHPEKLQQHIDDRRHALLGPWYDSFHGVPEPSPKKPPASIHINVLAGRRAA